MECKNCGTPNTDDATYCKKCGKRLDGMDICPACGKLTPADGDFCINCGANKHSPVAPVTAGHAAGAPMAEAAAAAVGGEVSAAAESEFVFEKYRGILKKVSAVFAALTALMGIIFVFLIDYAVTISYSGASARVSSGEDIFYFFGDAYDLITSGLSTYAENALAAGTVCATLLCVAGMAVTIVCFLAALLRMFRRGKSEKGLIGPCAATYISFVCTAVLFMSCVAASFDMDGAKGSFTLGGAAIAGIVLGAVFLAVSVAAEVMANLKRASVRPAALNGLFGVAMVALGFVALGVMTGGFGGIIDESSGEDISANYGLYMFFSMVLAAYAPTSKSSSYDDMYLAELAFAVVFVIAAIALVIFLTAALSKILACKGGDISSKAIKYATVAGLCAVICGAIMLAGSLVYVDYLDNDYCEASLAMPIVVMVFGVLLAAAAVVYKNRSKISTFAPYLEQ